jgi:hypothetical protein
MVEDNGTPTNATSGESPRRKVGLFGARRTGRRATQAVPRAEHETTDAAPQGADRLDEVDADATAATARS